MSEAKGIYGRPGTDVPPDDLSRKLIVARPDSDGKLEHLGVVGDTYTILLTGNDTAGQFCLIDMHIPPGGGPPPHRHDFEETFMLLSGELQATFRGKTMTVREGETINIPANAPHQFHNASQGDVRLLCLCSPAGQENLFRAIGVPVATRTTPAPKPTPEQEVEMKQKMTALAPLFRTEILERA